MPDQDAAAEERAALEQSARGMAVRRQVLSNEHVDRATAAADAFTAPFQDLITRYAWGEVWTRPGLTRPERSMITLTALACCARRKSSPCTCGPRCATG